jgi:hypothetical protein
MAKAVAKVEEVQTAVQQPARNIVALQTPEQSWLQTIERLAPAVGIDGVRELMTMRREERALEAAREFNVAMASAKAEFEPIVKTHLVEYGKDEKKTSYKHETLGDIAIVDPILAKHGLFTRYRATSNLNEPISVTCIVSHKLGHSEETTLKAGADNSGGKNSIQSMASTVTYLQRYTKILALGIATKHGDDDGRAAGEKARERITDEQVKEVEGLIEKAGVETQVILDKFSVKALEDLTPADHKTAISKLKATIKFRAS